MTELLVNFPYIREFLASKDILDLHSACPAFLVKKSNSSFADVTVHYFHDASPSTLF